MRRETSHYGAGNPLPKWVFLVGVGAMVLWHLGVAWPFFLLAIAWPAVPLVMRDVAAHRRRRETGKTAVS